jgi:hypothetical protein
MSQIDIKTLAEFKRFLALPGATVQIVQHDSMLPINRDDPEAVAKREAFLKPRTVAKVRSNTVQFINGSWLRHKAASHYRFHGNRVTIDLKEDGSFSKVMVYECSIMEGANN